MAKALKKPKRGASIREMEDYLEREKRHKAKAEKKKQLTKKIHG
jgi:hypothetical protein